MGSSRALTTWGKHGRFSYLGDLARGTKVKFGRDQSFIVPASVYDELFRIFGAREFAIGLSLRPPRESLGAFLASRLGRQGLAAYVGPLLVAEKAAERLDDQTMRLRERRGDDADGRA